jgi:hypothetical protein
MTSDSENKLRLSLNKLMDKMELDIDRLPIVYSHSEVTFDSLEVLTKIMIQIVDRINK